MDCFTSLAMTENLLSCHFGSRFSMNAPMPSSRRGHHVLGHHFRRRSGMRRQGSFGLAIDAFLPSLTLGGLERDPSAPARSPHRAVPAADDAVDEADILAVAARSARP